MADPSVAVAVLGCKVNQTEAESLTVMFRNAGYRTVDFAEKADVYVIHTCTVTGESDKKSRNLIRRAVRQNPQAVVAVTGCFAQVSSQEVEDLEGVDVILGVGSLSTLVERVETVRQGGKKVSAVRDLAQTTDFEELPEQMSGRARAFLKVQEGCRQYCTYCIIPFARGPVRSRFSQETLERVREVVAAGYQEVVLTGIRLGAYGVDLQPRTSLAELIELLVGIPGLKRLRLSSVDPHDFTSELETVVTRNPIVCPHYHIPLQSGDDAILARMGRRYTAAEFTNLISRLRQQRPLAAFTTDVMVGFPGEEESHFENTKHVLRECGFMGVHVFKYSPRKGTPAAEFGGQAAPAVKARRSKEIQELGAELFTRYAGEFLEQEVEVLVEHQDREGLWEGHTPNYLKVKLASENDLTNQLVKAKVEKIGHNFVFGTGIWQR